MKLHFLPEGLAVQINKSPTTFRIYFPPPLLLSQSEACYNLTQPCKSLGTGLPTDKRSLSLFLSKLWLDQHFVKSDDRHRGQAQVCAWGAQAPGIKHGSGCLREMPPLSHGGENTGARNDPLHSRSVAFKLFWEDPSDQSLHHMPGVFPKIPSMLMCCPKKFLVSQEIRNRAKVSGEIQARKAFLGYFQT